MANPRPSGDITRFVIERYSVPNPGKGPSPAKVRNSELEWMHYENHKTAALVLEVEIRDRGHGNRRQPQCLMRIIHGGNQHREIAIDEYREAYDNARTARDGGRRGDYGNGSGYQGRMEAQDEQPLVDTMRFTVKPPSIAIRLLHPLIQLTSDYYYRHRLPVDYTYDRFQIRFANTQDIPVFLAIIYEHFPALNPEPTANSQQIRPDESIALSQNTFPYMPDDPYFPIRRPEAFQQQFKRRRIDEENDSYGRQRYGQEEESRRGGQGDEYGRERSEYRAVRLPLHHDRGLPESSYVFPPHITQRRTSPETHPRQPSFDQDGFAKPLPPAYIDTPTPANRIYHLKQLDPNQKRSHTHRPLAASPKKATMMASRAAHDPFQHGRNISNHMGQRIGVPVGSGETRHTFYLPPVRQQMSCPPFINQSIASQATGYTLPPPPGVQTGMQQIESRHGSPGMVGFPSPAGRLLAPETVSISATKEGPSTRPWPAMYGSPVTSGSRAGVSAVGDTPDLHRPRMLSPPPLAGVMSAGHHAHMLGRQEVDDTTTEDNRNKTARIQERTADNQSANPEMAQRRDTLQHVTQQITANITQASSLYALSFEELEDAIAEIITEDGFIPFVENLSRSFGQRLSILAERGRARDGDIPQHQEESNGSAHAQQDA